MHIEAACLRLVVVVSGKPAHAQGGGKTRSKTKSKNHTAHAQGYAENYTAPKY
jgi:hypothetical protein